MNTNRINKSTKTMRAVSANSVLTNCCEKECGMTIVVEKEELSQGRKNRCTACMMKAKISRAL